MERRILLTKLLSRLLGCLCVVGLGMVHCHTAAQSFMSPPDFRHGAVMARSIVLDKNGQPILVEYNPDGTEKGVVTNLGDYADKVDKLVIINAIDYHLEKARLDAYKSRHSNDLALDAEIMSREDFQDETYVMADGKTHMSPPALPDHVKSVLVRGRSNRIVNEPQQLVLISFSIDLSEEAEVPVEGSVVLTPKGKVQTSSELLIGPRVAFYGDPEKNNNNAANPREHDDKIFGPVKNVRVYMAESVFRGATDTTDQDGKYSFRFNVPSCPGFSYVSNASVYADLRYANFSPLGASEQTYPLIQPSLISCNGSHALLAFSPFGGTAAFLSLEAQAALRGYSDKQVDLFADVMFLSGRVVIKNPDGSPVAIGATTEYDVKAASETKATQSNYDFDGDGKADTAVLGIVEDQIQEDGSVKKVFKNQPNGPLQAVYFSSNTKPSGQPDAIRIADATREMGNNGLLKSISKDDFQNTDVLVFRESTGQLYMQRKGLPDDDLEYKGAADDDETGQTGLGKDGKYFYYRLMVRGVMDLEIDFSGPEPKGGWNDWSTGYELEESFRKHESNHLRSGEWVRIVVINRATGYMGTRRVQLNEASQNDKGMMSTPVEEIVLSPPNLKIWAERTYEHKYGLEKNKEQINVIGAEGGALNDDKLVTVYTEWYDEEGRPLPSGLGEDSGEQFGLTGRMARIIGSGQIGEVGVVGKQNLAQFPIMPGHHTQVLNIKSNLTAAEHFYIHVSGTAKNESPKFDSGNTTQALAGRPIGLTPFLTPLYDENQDWKAWSAWNQVKRAYDAELLDEEPTKPLPSYVWSYRPEYQFSQFGLEMESILREYTDEAGQKNSQELLLDQAIDKKIPTIRSNDDLVSIFYSLFQQQHERLTPVDGEQELVFSLGANEVKATISANGELRFDNLAHIDLIDPTDLLTLRLYLNHDAGNTLWEWAFTRNGLHVYYSVPGNGQLREGAYQNDIEILSLLADDALATTVTASSQNDPVVRTLGGVRLRYRYIPPSMEGIKVKKITWKIGQHGMYCKDYGIDAAGCDEKSANQELTYTASGDEGLSPEKLHVYWQPTDDSDNALWSLWAGTKTEDDGIEASLKVDYELPVNLFANPSQRVTRTYHRNFKIKTRELKPETDPKKIMEGSDVAILEAMLWQLGISPQKGSMGKGGARIYSDRGSYKGQPLGFTQSCDGSDPKLRNIYNGGWSGCDSGKVSMEGMVTRFNSRSFEATEQSIKSAASSKGGVFDEGSLTQLGKVWTPYIDAIKNEKSSYEYSDISSASWKALLNALIGNVTYVLPNKNIAVSIDYNDIVHNEAMRVTGNSSVSRETFVKAWVSKENDRQWGANSTPYRISEGSADEVGSIGFSQMWFSYIFGQMQNCKFIKDVNMYNPHNNLLGFAIWSANGCGGGLYKAFSTSEYTVQPHANTVDMLVGYRCTEDDTGAHKPNGICAYKVDNYEKLVKGLTAYNAGSGKKQLKKCSLPEMVASLKNGSSSCQYSWVKGEGLDYPMVILHNYLSLLERDTKKLDLPHREYIWVGDRHDKNLKLADGITPDPNAGKPKWCFAFGEKEWREKKSWTLAKEQANDVNKYGTPQTPVGRVNCN